MTLEPLLLLGAALFAIGVYGALSQRSVVMVLMGLELMLAGIMGVAAVFWRLTATTSNGQILVLVLFAAMAVQMAVGFAVVASLFRSTDEQVAEKAAEVPR